MACQDLIFHRILRGVENDNIMDRNSEIDWHEKNVRCPWQVKTWCPNRLLKESVFLITHFWYYKIILIIVSYYQTYFYDVFNETFHNLTRVIVDNCNWKRISLKIEHIYHYNCL